MSQPILCERAGRVGRIRLASPETANAMSLAAFETIGAALEEYAQDDAIAAVLIDSLGDRGFCVGGDAVALARSGREDGAWAQIYFERQADLNARIHSFPKPIVTIADGATMGGGLGLLLPARLRVATGRTVVAFAETSVGMVPDVGASWILPRLPGATGLWLGLTGAKVTGRDLLRRGLADCYVEPADLPEFVAAILADPAAIPPPVAAGEIDPQVEQGFAHPTLPAILESLAAADDPWSAKQLAAIRRASPTATLAAFDLIRRGADFTSFNEALHAEVALNSQLVRGHDWLSFTRAHLLEKDQPPTRSPATIEDALAQAVA